MRTPVPKCLHEKNSLGGILSHFTFLEITGNPAPVRWYQSSVEAGGGGHLTCSTGEENDD